MNKKNKCVICGEPIIGEGHNYEVFDPDDRSIVMDGKCCDRNKRIEKYKHSVWDAKAKAIFAGSINEKELMELQPGCEKTFAIGSIWMKDDRYGEIRITRTADDFKIWVVHA